MKNHLLEIALTAASLISAIVVVWWGIKILVAWTSTNRQFDELGMKYRRRQFSKLRRRYFMSAAGETTASRFQN